MIKPRTPPGVMELLPRDQIAFQRMLDTIRRVYERFGFLPVETPVFELSDVLLTKTGGETERQVYFVQSTGALQNAAEGEGGLPEMALRFDLTVPLARFSSVKPWPTGVPVVVKCSATTCARVRIRRSGSSWPRGPGTAGGTCGGRPRRPWRRSRPVRGRPTRQRSPPIPPARSPGPRAPSAPTVSPESRPY